MNKNGPIIIIEDDPDDKDFFNIVFKELNYPNKVEYFTSGKKALEYLNRTDITPFMILSDINMPELNGFEICFGIRKSFDSKTKTLFNFLI